MNHRDNCLCYSCSPIPKRAPTDAVQPLTAAPFTNEEFANVLESWANPHATRRLQLWDAAHLLSEIAPRLEAEAARPSRDDIDEAVRPNREELRTKAGRMRAAAGIATAAGELIEKLLATARASIEDRASELDAWRKRATEAEMEAAEYQRILREAHERALNSPAVNSADSEDPRLVELRNLATAFMSVREKAWTQVTGSTRSGQRANDG